MFSANNVEAFGHVQLCNMTLIEDATVCEALGVIPCGIDFVEGGVTEPTRVDDVEQTALSLIFGRVALHCDFWRGRKERELVLRRG